MGAICEQEELNLEDDGILSSGMPRNKTGMKLAQFVMRICACAFDLLALSVLDS